MASEDIKLKKSLDNLKKTLKFMEQAKETDKDVAFLSVAKAFEVAVEYAWRDLQKRIEEEGLDAPSPKAAVREAARINLIENAESWIDYISARNAGVHDYFGMTNEAYIEIAKEFLEDAEKMIRKAKGI